jgi:hypothetical protein
VVRAAKNIGLFVGAALFFFVAVKLGSATRSIYDNVVDDDERYYLPSAGWLGAFSAGYNEVVTDFVWVKTVVYFGGSFLSSKDESNEDESSSFTVNYLSTAAELDPKFRRLYTRGSGLTLFQKNGVVTEKTVKASIDLLERGARAFPDDGEIAFQLGFMNYYEMEPFLPKEKDHPTRRFHKEHGAELIRRAALMDRAPSYAAGLSFSLLSKEGLDDLIIEHLKKLLVKETNEKIRETLLYQLRKEAGKAAEREIETSEKLLTEWRENLPFVPFDLYLIIARDFPVDELINPLWWTNRLLGLDEESQDAEDSDGLEADMRDGDLP